jgi:hypothetical protein
VAWRGLAWRGLAWLGLAWGCTPYCNTVGGRGFPVGASSAAMATNEIEGKGGARTDGGEGRGGE